LTIKEQENLVNGLLPVKTPMFLLFKTNFHHDACGGFRQKNCTMRNVTETVKQLIIINVLFIGTLIVGDPAYKMLAMFS
jgi:hypothetical protein